ncbi:DUF5417 domain-containing protein [Enterobacter hormaechei]|uniref:DUF5417 domain-containing protein n=1 Tax=Enterobacter hormaechei TaxID=158836 RepID=UPI0039C0C929
MKLVRQSLTDLDNDTREKSPWGARPSDLYRGRIHHFYIENATPAELIAMDDLLMEAGWESDTCPNYEEDDEFGHAGYSCGYWIDIEEVARFRADYKRLKGEMGARVAINLAKTQSETLDAMTEEEVRCVARVSRQVARELRRKQESLTGLRGIGTYRDIILNPYHNSHNPITKQGWKLIFTVLHIGSLENVITGLYELEKGCEASAERFSVIPELMKQIQGVTYEEARHAIRGADFCFATAVTWLREQKRKQVDAELAKCLPDFRNMTESEKKEAIDEAYVEATGMNAAFDNSFQRRAANWGAMDVMSREIELEKAHDQALATNRYLDILAMNARHEAQRQARPQWMKDCFIAMDSQEADEFSRLPAADAHACFASLSDDVQAVVIEIAHAAALESEARKEAMRQAGTAGINYVMGEEHADVWAGLNSWEDMRDEARRMDRLIGNTDLLPGSGFNAADAEFVIAATERRYPGMMAADILTAHTEALAQDEVFNTCNARFNHFWSACSLSKRCETVEQAHVEALEADRLYTDSMRAIAAPGGAYAYLADECVKRQAMNVAHRDALEMNAVYDRAA